MRTLEKYLFIAMLLSVLVISCSTVPLTGRRQLDIIPSSTMLSMSFQQYSDFLDSNKLSKDAQQTQLVKSVG